MELKLDGKTALVMASSQGLGKAVAEQFLKEGAMVMITSRSEDKLQALKEEFVKQYPGQLEYYRADMTKPEEIRKLAEKTRDIFGGIDVLINNSGGPTKGTFSNFSDSDWQDAFELNLLSYVRVIRETLPDLKKRRGKIINIASSSIKQPIPGLLLSNVFRLGVVGLTKTLAGELAKDGILINTVAPGRISTDRLLDLNRSKAKKINQPIEQIEELSQSEIPLGRYGTPEEFAKMVVFLASGANTYVTGTSLIVDGGLVQAI
ncbi:MAG: SDR family oxidoreductase [Bacillus sp. (in: firmicutes)]